MGWGTWIACRYDGRAGRKTAWLEVRSRRTQAQGTGASPGFRERYILQSEGFVGHAGRSGVTDDIQRRCTEPQRMATAHEACTTRHLTFPALGRAEARPHGRSADGACVYKILRNAGWTSPSAVHAPLLCFVFPFSRPFHFSFGAGDAYIELGGDPEVRSRADMAFEMRPRWPRWRAFLLFCSTEHGIRVYFSKGEGTQGRGSEEANLETAGEISFFKALRALSYVT